DQAQQANEVLRHEVEQTESERKAMEANLREVLGNLRHAAKQTGRSRPSSLPGEEATLIPSSRPDNGWEAARRGPAGSRREAPRGGAVERPDGPTLGHPDRRLPRPGRPHLGDRPLVVATLFSGAWASGRG